MRALLILAAIAAIPGCATSDRSLGTSINPPAERAAYVEAHPDLSVEHAESIRNGIALIGMSREDVSEGIGYALWQKSESGDLDFYYWSVRRGGPFLTFIFRGDSLVGVR